MISEVLFLARSHCFFKRSFACGISKFSTQTMLTNVKPAENGKAVSDKKHEADRSVKVTKHIRLYQADKSAKSKKPLVLLFRWLYAKPSAVNKYCDLYHDIGMDVVSVKGKLSHFLWPPEAVKLSDELFDYLKSNHPHDQKCMVHAFSIGAFNYTIAMQAAMERQKETGNFRERVIGQIFDSVVLGTYDNMSHGIVQVLPKNNQVRKMIHFGLQFYYNITHKTTTETYDKLVTLFKKKPIPVPTLVIYTENDPMCDVAAMEQMLEDWKSIRPPFDVRKLSWRESTHAAHLREHNEDYVREWRTLMKKLKLL